MSFVTVVIPVYNDNTALMRAIPESLKALEAFGRPFELIVAEDASTDGTKETAGEWAAKDSRVIHLHSDVREGRGKALNRALAIAQGDIFCYYDVDLATSLEHLPELLSRIENGADVVTGSRLMKSSEITRSTDREIASRSYNFLVRKLLKSNLCDHQCGFKAYKTEVLKHLITEIEAPHWFWDTESLVLAEHEGLRVEEFPIHWTQGPGTTVRMKDVTSMGKDILKLRRRLRH
ncbi:MAG TPA: glycosyltransferase [Methanocorpusculum sp.]|nr:glycosyltransferase [Methanocorpusculum sp.]